MDPDSYLVLPNLVSQMEDTRMVDWEEHGYCVGLVEGTGDQVAERWVALVALVDLEGLVGLQEENFVGRAASLGLEV